MNFQADSAVLREVRLAGIERFRVRQAGDSNEPGRGDAARFQEAAGLVGAVRR
jgi:hypothetical protein